MSALEDLSDEEVLALARHWRGEALRGDKNARGLAHEYEVEHRRRSGGVRAEPVALKVSAPLGEIPAKTNWRLWKKGTAGGEFA